MARTDLWKRAEQAADSLLNVEAGAELAFAAQGLHLREWRLSDAEQMSRLFNTDEMNRWTPLPHPFTEDVAVAYAERARQRIGGVLQLALCLMADGPPVGELLAFPAPERDTVELAYAVGAEHRHQHIGSRAVLAALELVTLSGTRRVVLTVAEDNAASQATARAAGFARTDSPLRRRERKGFVLMMETWERTLDPGRR